MPTEQPKSRTTRSAMIFAAVLVALTAGALRLDAFPEPSLVQRSWQLDITPQQTLKPIAVRDLLGRIQWYWYLIYTVENNSGSERLFIPEITIATDEGHILISGQNVPTGIFEAIAKKERNTLLLSPAKVIGRILQGPDFVKQSVAIWPAYDKPVDHVQVFLNGLSGETAAIRHPLTDEPVVMSKTLMLSFRTPGSEVSPELQPVIYDGETWVMR